DDGGGSAEADVDLAGGRARERGAHGDEVAVGELDEAGRELLARQTPGLDRHPEGDVDGAAQVQRRAVAGREGRGMAEDEVGPRGPVKGGEDLRVHARATIDPRSR